MDACISSLRRLRFIAFVMAALAACSPAAGPVATHPSPNASPMTACGSSPPLAGIYQSDRLQILAACRHAAGRVVSVVPEDDGDYHVWIVLDPAYSDLMNAEDHFQGKPTMLAEIVPDCAADSPPPDSSSAHRCPPTRLAIPTAGERIAIDGPWVLDTNHGWREIHPVDTIVILGS
jgi:hypothetical protein